MVMSVSARIGPFTTCRASSSPSASSSPLSPCADGSVVLATGSESGNAPPRTGCQRAAGSTRSTAPETTAAPSGGEMSRVAVPSCVTDAATRNSTAPGGRPAAAASVARTAAIRSRRICGELVAKDLRGAGQRGQRLPRRGGRRPSVVGGDCEVRAEASQAGQFNRWHHSRHAVPCAAGHTAAVSFGWREGAAADPGARSRSAIAANSSPITAHKITCAVTEYSRKLNSTSAGNPG